VVSDEFPLYGRTVYEAIVYSRKKEQEIKVSKLLQKLQKFEDESNRLNLHDKIGDLGNALTRGQKKILMYCRALLTNKSMLIIDQPFRYLNNKTIDHIKDILISMKDGKTIILLDNKIPEGLNADHVYSIENKTFIKNQ